MSRERRVEEISALTEMTVLKQMQRGASMAAYQPPRSKFMINDILGGNGKLKSSGGSDERTLSPQPRDLSVFLHSIPENDDDSDCDSSKYSLCVEKSPSECFLIVSVFHFELHPLNHSKLLMETIYKQR